MAYFFLDQEVAQKIKPCAKSCQKVTLKAGKIELAHRADFKQADRPINFRVTFSNRNLLHMGIFSCFVLPEG
ncbi:hypothetical protein [Cardinium endosymbiont of Oedothorax gibbosus]|uniref:hypothetical protein n=1 Tax=Cardinium endosymbiont of Oedothorax gibbosus TaxID=931101 RepID=UPI002023C083|nr:hypothetical protein [Cardinium endosymbiont of Oedothorax gibbosus]